MIRTRSNNNIDITTRLEKLENDLNTNNQLLANIQNQIEQINQRQ
jgi:hypothetical protein